MSTRMEKDSLGEMQVPETAYWGAQTARAVRNFPISSSRFGRPFLRAIGLIKRAAADVNLELGLLDARLSGAIAQAAQEVADGKHDGEFVLDIYQTGSGTSTNMNANEVIANRAAEILGQPRGGKHVHPNDHVNRGQSSNDVIPTAIQLAGLLVIRDALRPAMEELRAAFDDKARAFMGIVKTGRTHLMDATPIRLGQEFRGYAGGVERGLRRIVLAESELREVPLGGTAVGTGIGTTPEFAARVLARVRDLCGVPLHETDNHFQAQSCLDAVVFASGALRTYASALMKIANDLRWLASGPRAGIAEISLPAVQPGSSIMPGKVNPVIVESTLMACARVLGNDATVATGNAWGNFELNTMMPVMCLGLIESAELLAACSKNLAGQCVAGIEATERGPALVEQGLMLATALAPVIGYDRAADLAKEAARTGRTIREIAREKAGLPEDKLAEILDPARMTEPGGSGPAGG
jgi:fumarate hydratase class II